MAIDENIYGSSDKWVKVYLSNPTWGSSVPNDELLKIANFSNTVIADTQADYRTGYSLGNAQYYEKLDPGEIFDTSICTVGLGGKSPYNAIYWYENDTSELPEEATPPFPVNLRGVDRNTISNFCFNTVNVTYGFTYTPLNLYSAQSSSTILTGQKDKYYRWSPTPLYSSTSQDYPFIYSGPEGAYRQRNQTTFVTQMPCRRVVWCPYIYCGQPTQTGGTTNTTSVDLDSYLSTYKDTHTRIIMIYMKPYIQRYNAEMPTSSNYRTATPLYLTLFSNATSLNGAWCSGEDNKPSEQITDEHPYYLPNVYGYDSGIPLGGSITGGNGVQSQHTAFNNRSTKSNTFDIQAYINCWNLLWNNWSGESGQPLSGQYPYCDATLYTADEIRENVMHAIACFGMFFTTNLTKARTGMLDDTGMFLGILENGVGYGQYTEGVLNREQPQFNWVNMNQSPYDPDNPPTPPAVDPNTYGVGMHTNAPWMTSPNRLYSINSTWISSIVSLYNSLWKCYYDNNVGMEEGQTPPTEFNFNEFLTVSPIDTIVSLKLFPYDTKSSTTNVGIRLGKYATGVNAYNALLYNVLDFGTVAIYPYFGDNWKDRETKYTLYAPFCGTLELDPAFYMGHTVGLEYWIDQVTGACTAALYITDNDNAKVYGDTVSGICAVDVPITGLDQATIQSQIFNANQQLKNANVNAASGLANAAMGIVASAAMGNAVGAATAAISGISNLIKNTDAVEAASYNLQHNKMSPRMIGAASPLCSMLGDWIPRIIVSIPIDPLSDAEQQQFSEIKGYSCIIPDKIGNHSGYVQAVNLKIVPPDQAAAAPTEEEVELIKSLVASGIYL